MPDLLVESREKASDRLCLLATTGSIGEILEVIHTVRETSYNVEQKIIQRYHKKYGYIPTSKGSWGKGTECFTDNCPIKLTDWF